MFALSGGQKQRCLKVNIRSKPRSAEPVNILRDLSCATITTTMTSGTGLSFFLEEKEEIGTIDIIESLKDPEPAAAAVPTSAPPSAATPITPVLPVAEAAKEASEPPANTSNSPSSTPTAF